MAVMPPAITSSVISPIIVITVVTIPPAYIGPVYIIAVIATPPVNVSLRITVIIPAIAVTANRNSGIRAND